jgi:2-dehydropantoate 2-reductase
MRLVILGAGAIGGVVGGLLARAGREVLLVARGAHLAAIRQGGLRVERPGETFVVHPPVVTTGDPIGWRPDDVVLLAVKTQDAATALRDLGAPAAIPTVCLTNGVEAERVALRHAAEVYGGCVVVAATHLAPGVVQAWGATSPGVIDLGRYPDGGGDAADAVAGELIVAGFDCVVRPNIMKWKRGKLLSNLANGIEALCGPGVRGSALAVAARAEGQAAFAAAGLSCTTEAEDAARRVGLELGTIAGATRGGGSTWQSLARGARAVEVDYLNGEIALLGRLHGVATPVNAALQRVVTAAARSGRSVGAMSLDALAAEVAACG